VGDSANGEVLLSAKGAYAIPKKGSVYFAPMVILIHGKLPTRAYETDILIFQPRPFPGYFISLLPCGLIRVGK
jgi:hypothetical protein